MMITVEEALEMILSYVETLKSVQSPVLSSLGQVLSENITAEVDIPPRDNSSMDGYALQARDTAGASPNRPVELAVTGELAAGYVFSDSVSPGSAVRIMTGAPIPSGADAVVPFEDTDEAGRRPPQGTAFTQYTVRVLKDARPGDCIRRAGEDMRRGETVLTRGRTLRPQEIGVLASLGKESVRVVRRPVVAILSTGDELTPLGQPLAPGKIYDSNAYSIAALVTRCGGTPKLLGIARDTVGDLTATIRNGLSGADMLVTSAGVSRGDYDVVKEVLAREGEVAFWTVAMKPGKPLAFGRFHHNGRSIPHLGLPGNPVSSMVSFELFGRPAIFKMLGKSEWRRPILRAVAVEPIINRDDPRRFYARCIVTQREDGRYYVSLTGAQGSGILTSMAAANALTVIPEDVDEVKPGEELDVMMLDWSHGEEWR